MEKAELVEIAVEAGFRAVATNEFDVSEGYYTTCDSYLIPFERLASDIFETPEAALANTGLGIVNARKPRA